MQPIEVVSGYFEGSIVSALKCVITKFKSFHVRLNRRRIGQKYIFGKTYVHVVQTYSVTASFVGHFRVAIHQVLRTVPGDERKLEPKEDKKENTMSRRQPSI